MCENEKRKENHEWMTDEILDFMDIRTTFKDKCEQYKAI